MTIYCPVVAHRPLRKYFVRTWTQIRLFSLIFLLPLVFDFVFVNHSSPLFPSLFYLMLSLFLALILLSGFLLEVRFNVAEYVAFLLRRFSTSFCLPFVSFSSPSPGDDSIMVIVIVVLFLVPAFFFFPSRRPCPAICLSFVLRTMAVQSCVGSVIVTLFFCRFSAFLFRSSFSSVECFTAFVIFGPFLCSAYLLSLF